MKFDVNEFKYIPCDYFKEKSEAISRGLIFNMQAGLIEQSLHNLDEESFLKLKNMVERIFFERWRKGEFRNEDINESIQEAMIRRNDA